MKCKMCGRLFLRRWLSLSMLFALIKVLSILCALAKTAKSISESIGLMNLNTTTADAKLLMPRFPKIALTYWLLRVTTIYCSSLKSTPLSLLLVNFYFSTKHLAPSIFQITLNSFWLSHPLKMHISFKFHNLNTKSCINRHKKLVFQKHTFGILTILIRNKSHTQLVASVDP